MKEKEAVGSILANFGEIPTGKRGRKGKPIIEVKPSRYGSGPRQEDIDYLAAFYNNAVEKGNISVGDILPFPKIKYFALQQLAGLPGSNPGTRNERIVVNQNTNKRVNRMLNDYQTNWNFEFVTQPSANLNSPPDVGLIVRNVKKVGHKRRRLLDI